MKKIFQDRIYSLSFTIILIASVYSILRPDLFPTFSNFRQVFLNLSVDTIVAVGMMILMIGGDFDLSVGSVVAFSGCLASYLMFFRHVGVGWAVFLALIASAVIGLINGCLVAFAHINPLIQTLAMMGIVRGLAMLVSGAGIQGLPYWFNAIGQSKLMGFQMPVWYMLGCVALFAFLFSRTVFFRRYYYIGSNERAAALSGIRVGRMKVYAFVLSALLAGIAGILLSSRLGAALSTSGQGLELRVITAIVLGGASLAGGQGKIIGALLGALFMGLVSNIMIIERVGGYWQQIILGIILILSLLLDSLLRKWKSE